MSRAAAIRAPARRAPAPPPSPPRRRAPSRHPKRASPPGRTTLRPVAAARPRRRHAPFVVLSGLIVGALVVGIVSLQALVSQTSFRMQDLQDRTATLQQQNGELVLRVARLSSPERIAAEAHRLGLVLPAHVEPLEVGGPGSRGSRR